MTKSDIPPGTQRRHFSRVAFMEEATFSSGDLSVACEVRDLSLKGALLKLSDPTNWPVGRVATLILPLDGESSATIRMDGVVAHRDGFVVGLRCTRIDLDSITHLRRLVELNIGDEATLQRELVALSAD